MRPQAAPGPDSGSVGDGVHRFDLRVYWEDTDAAGIVYYANYLKFAERARTEMLRLLGFSQEAQRRQTGVVFAVRACTIEYLSPARLDDALTVESGLAGLGHASLDLAQTIWCGERKLAGLALRIACLGPTLKPARLPAELRRALAPFAVHKSGPRSHSAHPDPARRRFSSPRGDTDHHGN
jgi:acyl-CoA thioester hydrolase